MCLHEVAQPLLLAGKVAKVDCKEEVGLREVAHYTGNVSTNVESSVTMAQREFRIGSFGVGIVVRSV